MSGFRFGDHYYDCETRELTLGEEPPVALKPKSAEVLEYLLRERDHVVTRETLFEAVWPDVIVSEQALNKVINELRAALNDTPRNSSYIKTYTKKGYGWIFPNTVEEQPEAVAPPEPEPEAAPVTEPQPKAKPRKLLWVALPLVVVLLTVLAFTLNRDTPPAGAETRYLAILPVVNHTGDPKNSWVETGLRDIVLQTLLEDGNYVAIEPKDLQKAVKLAGLKDAPPTKAQLEQLQSLFPDTWLISSELTTQDGSYVLDYRVFSDKKEQQRRIEADSLLKCGHLLAYNLLAMDGNTKQFERHQARMSRDDFTGETYAKGMEFLNNRELDKAINHFEVCLDNDPTMTWALLQLARSHRLKGNNKEAGDLFSKVYEKSQIEKNPILEAQSLRYMGLMALHKGEWERSLSLSKRCLAIYSSLGDKQGEILAGNQIATLHARLQQVDEAEAILKSNWQEVRKLGNKYLLATTSVKLATVLSMKGKIEEAETSYYEALEATRALNDWRNVASILENLGNIHYLRKAYERATDYYQQALDISKEHNNKRIQASALHNLGVVAMVTDNHDVAATRLQEAMTLSKEIEDNYLENKILYNMGGQALRSGKVDEAGDLFQQAIETALRLDNVEIYLDSACYLALVHIYRNEYKAALDWLQKIEAQSQEIPAFFATQALLAYQQNDWQLAHEHQEHARELAGDTWSVRDENRLSIFRNASLQNKKIPLVDPNHIPLF